MQDRVMAGLPPHMLTEELIDGSNLTPGQRLFTEALQDLSLLQKHVGVGVAAILLLSRDSTLRHAPMDEVRGAVVQMCEIDGGIYPVGLFSRARNLSLVGGANRDRMTRCRLDAPPLQHHPVGLRMAHADAIKMPVAGPLFLRLNDCYVELRTQIVAGNSLLTYATVARFRLSDVKAGTVTFKDATKDLIAGLVPNQTVQLRDGVKLYDEIARLTTSDAVAWRAQPVPDGPASQMLIGEQDGRVFFDNARLTQVFGALLLQLTRRLKEEGPQFMGDKATPYPRMRVMRPVDPCFAAFDPNATVSQLSRSVLDMFLNGGVENDSGEYTQPTLTAPEGRLTGLLRNRDGSTSLTFDTSYDEQEVLPCPRQFVLDPSVEVGATFTDGQSLGKFDFSEAEVTLNGVTLVQSVRLPLRLQQLCMGLLLQHLSVYPGEADWPEDAEGCLFDPQLIDWPHVPAPGFVDTRNLDSASWDETMGGYVSPLFVESEQSTLAWGNMRLDLPYSGRGKIRHRRKKSQAQPIGG